MLKKHTFLDCQRVQWIWIERTPKRHIYEPYQVCIMKFQLPSLIWKEVRRGTVFFQFLKNEEHPHISPPNWLQRLVFGYEIQLLILYRLVWKKSIFCVFDLLAPPHPHAYWGIIEFRFKFIPIHIYLIRHQTEPINRIWVILVSIKQCKKSQCLGKK